MSKSRVKEQLIQSCKMLHTKNMLAGADGNLSYKVSEKEILITPSGISKAFISPEDIAIIDIDNNILYGNPSSERLMHLEVYRTCEKAKCVFHAHPPTAIAWSVAYPEMRELPNQCLSEVVLATGHVPIVNYARPGTQDMGEVLKPHLPKQRALILSRHGALVWAESIDEAYRGMERIEHSAEILYRAATLKELTYISDAEFAHLKKLREKIGEILL